MKQLKDPEIAQFQALQPDLLDTPVSSELDKIVAKAEQIAHSHPKILEAIERDQDAHGLKKKTLRLADRAFIEAQTPTLNGLEIKAIESNPAANATELLDGRPRMPAVVVLVFLILRGWLGGPKSVNFRLILRESITLRQFLTRHEMNVPGPSTIADNINTVSAETQQLIHCCQLTSAKDEGLDTFETVRIDSTAAASSSKYPTDSGLMAALAMRLIWFFTALAKLGLPDLSLLVNGVKSAGLAREIELESKKIGMMSGKQGVKEERKKAYQKIYSRVGRLTKKVRPLFDRACQLIEALEVVPSQRQRVEALRTQAERDLTNIATIAEYSAERVLEDKPVSAEVQNPFDQR